jgi:hypothetical protein
MSSAAAVSVQRFVRRTRLGANEYHTRFRKIDCETISRITSEEASRASSQMCKVYLSLVNAPAECWEREGVLRFAGEERQGEWTTAWEQLVALVGVASATARKALRWMHDEGIIGYFAGKNGVGIRIFLNRAASSIGHRQEEGPKILRLVHASNEGCGASVADTPFRDSFADREILEKDLNSHAPKNGADSPCDFKIATRSAEVSRTPFETAPSVAPQHSPEVLTGLLLRELEPALRGAAARAAAREHERTREWLESKGLPKAARVAQREAYKVLRQHGLAVATRDGQAALRHESVAIEARALAPEELRELAETCVTMLEVHGHPVEVTLAGLRVEAGGMLLAEDVPKVRRLAEELARVGRIE